MRKRAAPEILEIILQQVEMPFQRGSSLECQRFQILSDNGKRLTFWSKSLLSYLLKKNIKSNIGNKQKWENNGQKGSLNLP